MMMDSSRNIAALPPEVISKLRSCVTITSVSQCVEELALNAVDSGAKNVAIRLDLTYYKIQVVDNGCGITEDQLQHVGERYHTSKCHNLEDLEQLSFHGFRGEALASLRDICAVIEITSRTYENRTYFKTFNYGNNSKVKLSTDERPSVGTTVTVLDFMYNMPVRRKSICSSRDFEFSRHCLEAIALINPKVSFTLRNDQTGEECLKTKRSDNILSSFRFLFGNEKVLKELVYNSTEGWKIHGVISTDGYTTKDLQFIYVNNRLVLKTRLHQLVKLVLSKYINSKNRERMSNYSPDISKSPKKMGNSIFVLNILCPFQEYDICFEPRKTLIEFQDWDKVTSFVEDALKTFLKSEGFERPENSPLKLSDINSTSIKLGTTNSSATEDINTVNTKNALFSLIIKRTIEEANDSLNNLEENKNEEINKQNTCIEKSPEAIVGDLNPHMNEEVHVSEQNTCFGNTPEMLDMKNNKDVNKSTSTPVDISKQIIKQSEHLNNSDQPKQGRCFLSETSTQEMSSLKTAVKKMSNPVFFPVALRTPLKPSPLSLLSKRKKLENKLEKIKAFKFQKSATLNQGPQKPSSSSNSKAIKKNNSKRDCNQITYSKLYHEQIIRNSTKQTSAEEGFIRINNNENNQEKFENKDKPLKYTRHEKVEHTTVLNQCVSETVAQINRHENPISASEPFIITQPFSLHLEEGGNSSSQKKNSVFDALINKSDNIKYQQTNISLETEALINTNVVQECLSMDIIETKLINTDDMNIQPGQQSPILNSVDILDQSEIITVTNTSDKNSLPSHNLIKASNTTNERNYFSEIVSNTFQRTSVEESPVHYQNNQNITEPIIISSSLGKSWFSWHDHDSGAVLYIDKMTGNSSYQPPFQIESNKEDSKQKQNLGNDAVGSHFFLSHNSAPFLPRPERKLEEIENYEDQSEVSNLLEAWENPVFKRAYFTEVTNAECGKKSSIQAYNAIQNYKFFKSMFDKVKFLGQVDCKFLACLVPSTPESNNDPELLVLFDQHAVHERIRLEQLTKDLYCQGGLVDTSLLQPPLRLEVGLEYVRLARAFSSQLEKSGLVLEVGLNKSSNALFVQRVPTCFSEREASELKNNRPSILASLTQALLEEELLRMKETGSVGGSMPKTILNVLSSRACKGAIKFGDPLEKSDCIQLIKHLSTCQLPFQCAHGRPSAIPIMNMAHVCSKFPQVEVQPPRLSRLKRNQCK